MLTSVCVSMCVCTCVLMYLCVKDHQVKYASKTVRREAFIFS